MLDKQLTHMVLAALMIVAAPAFAQTDGSPVLDAVASAMAVASFAPASTAISSQRPNCSSGSAGIAAADSDAVAAG